MIEFPVTKRAYLANATFLNGISSFSFCAWAMWPSFDAARHQYVFSHRESTSQTNQLSFRKVSGGTRARFSVTAGGVVVSLDSNTLNPITEDQIYFVAGRWQKNNASGIAIRVDGASDVTASTTSQTSDYDSGSSTCPLVIAGQTPDSQTGIIAVEDFMIFPNAFLSDAQLDALRNRGWPYLAALKAGVHWGLDTATLTDFPDLSGNGRHVVAANISTGITALGRKGRRTAPGRKGGSWRGLSPTAGAPGPGEWVAFVPDILHPATVQEITGLTDGVAYDFKATALDQNLNESADSNILTATPAGPPDTPVVHTPKEALATGATA